MATMTWQEERALDNKLTEEAKPGDKWLRYGSHSFSHRVPPTLVTVEKVTKTRITFDNGETIMKASGKVVGQERFGRISYNPATEARLTDQAKLERSIAADTAALETLETLTQRVKDGDVEFKESFVALVESFLKPTE